MPATIDIPFPTSSMPGQRPGEGQGRLVNCYCEVDGKIPTWRAVPGLASLADTGGSGPRGSIVKGNLLYVAMRDAGYTISGSGLVTKISGTIDGSQPVTWAQNNKAPSPDLVLVNETDVYGVSATTVLPLGQVNLPNRPNSVSQLDGYFLFFYNDKRIFASDLNNVNVNALSFTTCQAGPGAGVRGIAWGSQFYAFCADRCEVYADAATQPFPLSRQTVMPVGLIGPWAITGFEADWDELPHFISPDCKVRELNGYQATPVSTKDVERAIAAVADKSSIRAASYVIAGNPFVAISSPEWTWERNIATGFWHERRSAELNRWRAETSVRFNNKWIVGDTLSGKLSEVTEAAQDEDGDPLPMILESGPVKQFPARLQPATGWFDFSTGQGAISGTDDAITPTVEVSTSKDGGGTWGTPVIRELGQQGEYSKPIRVNRIAGTASQHGLRIRLLSSSPVPRSFRGGRLTVDQRAPA